MATKNEAERFALTIAAQVRAEIGARDSSVSAIARATGINRETLDRWVKGERQFNISNLFRVASALGMDTHLLVKRAEERFIEENADSKLAETEAEIIVGRFKKSSDVGGADENEQSDEEHIGDSWEVADGPVTYDGKMAANKGERKADELPHAE